jgi:elongation factor Ts
MLVTARMVKELRDISGAGMMDAKKALVEVDGDMQAAIDWLRTKGLAKADKKSARVAAEGLIAFEVVDDVAVLLEVNSETDFVAKNGDFQDIVSKLVKAALFVDSVDDLLESDVAGATVRDIVKTKISTIGENINIRRMQKIFGKNIVSYVHNAVNPNMGKIGVVIALTKENQTLGKQLAMHIAAANPIAHKPENIDEIALQREKAIFREQALETGKPDKVIDTMVEGKLKKYLNEVVLVNQKFVINPDLTVKQVLEENGIEIVEYARFEVGDGIEKEENDFAAEVAKTIAN